MSYPVQHTARLPRHPSATDNPCHLEVQRLDGQSPSLAEGLLVDISRNGAQILVSTEIEAGESVVLRFSVEDSELDVSLTATVRWCRPESAELFAVGCALDSEIDWETLGELFLSGVLSRDLPAAESPLP